MNPIKLTCQLVALLSLLTVAHVNCSRDWSEDEYRYKWYDYSKNKINKILNRKINKNVAKNIVLYLGDGMGMSTITAGRILKGQLADENGEEHVTTMESMDFTAISKTYNINAQTPDSAGTATAFHTGVKSRIGSIGVDGTAVDCKTSLKGSLESVLKWAHFAGKSTGIVTTTRITHATPAASYANVPNRDWEAYDDKYFGEKEKSEGCKDIAAQLIEDNSFINVIIGGGRRSFLRNTDEDYAKAKDKGKRTDNRNLIDEWHEQMESKNLTHKFVWNMTDFMGLNPDKYERVLALLNHDHMKFEVNRDPSVEPSISQMVKKAIQILSRNPKGFYLLVEGGRIDHGHHNGKAKQALTDFVAFDNAIATGLSMTDEEETLSVVTADHSHVFTIGGYNQRGNNIFHTNIKADTGETLDGLNRTYTPLLYGNGPGGLTKIRTKNLTNAQTEDKDYRQEAVVNLEKETHGGEDVAIYASGPMSYLFVGTVEQSHIAHLMAYSACIGLYNETMYKNCAADRGIVSTESPRGLLTRFNYYTSSASSWNITFKNSLLAFLMSTLLSCFDF